MDTSIYKKEIITIVEDYKRNFEKEYKLVCEGVAIKKGMTKDEYHRVDNSSMRGLFEISETLSSMLTDRLKPDAIVWFKTIEGGRFFASEYKEFALPNYI
jgi:hypothetical protein